MPHAEPSGRPLYTVAQIQHLLRVEFGRARRYAYPLGCLVVSIDQLAALRDRHGFEAKERVFESVLGLIARLTRTSDFLGRGADETLLLLVPHTGRAGLVTLGERLVAGAAQLGLAGLVEPGELSLSLGWAATDEREYDFHDALLTAAEQAHGEAQTTGGNRARGAGN